MLVTRLCKAALLAVAANAATDTKFTKVVNSNGSLSKFIDLSLESQSVIATQTGASFVPSKLRFDPLKMLIDLSDTSFAKISTSASDVTRLDLTETLFKFMDGAKVVTLDKSQRSVKVQVDNDALMEKY